MEARIFFSVSFASDALTAIESAILARLQGGAIDSYSVNGQDVSLMNLKDLQALRDQLRSEVLQEAGTGGSRITLARLRPRA